MIRRAVVGLTCLLSLLSLACESTTAPEVKDWTFQPAPYRSLVSSEMVKTVLRTDGTLYSWGLGSGGTLGQGNLKDQVKPTKIPGLQRVVDYDQNGGMAFALTEDGSIYQWGMYIFSSALPEATLKPTRAIRVPGAVAIFAQQWELYIVDGQGALWKTGPSHRDPRKTEAPQRIPLPKEVSQISGAVGLARDGTLFNLWPTEPEEGGALEGFGGIVSVHNNFQSTVALRNDGTVWAWGYEEPVTPVDEDKVGNPVPTPIPGMSGVKLISGSGYFRFAVKDDGTVWYWGIRGWDDNHDPILQTVPAQVPGITDAVDVSANWEALIRTATGALYVFDTERLNLTEVERIPD